MVRITRWLNDFPQKYHIVKDQYLSAKIREIGYYNRKINSRKKFPQKMRQTKRIFLSMKIREIDLRRKALMGNNSIS